jgi:hypothetical protein
MGISEFNDPGVTVVTGRISDDAETDESAPPLILAFMALAELHHDGIEPAPDWALDCAEAFLGSMLPV